MGVKLLEKKLRNTIMAANDLTMGQSLCNYINTIVVTRGWVVYNFQKITMRNPWLLVI